MGFFNLIILSIMPILSNSTVGRYSGILYMLYSILVKLFYLDSWRKKGPTHTYREAIFSAFSETFQEK